MMDDNDSRMDNLTSFMECHRSHSNQVQPVADKYKQVQQTATKWNQVQPNGKRMSQKSYKRICKVQPIAINPELV